MGTYLVAFKMLAVDRVVTPSREALVLLLEASWGTAGSSESNEPCRKVDITVCLKNPQGDVVTHPAH